MTKTPPTVLVHFVSLALLTSIVATIGWAETVITAPGELVVLDEDVQGFCARAERQGHILEGRRYDLDIEAADVCGNVSDATEIGNIHVPRDMSAGLQCIDSTLP